MAKFKKIEIEHHNFPSHKVLVGIPSTGCVRIEWALAYFGTITPTNFQLSLHSPIGLPVAEARNQVVEAAINGKFDWIFFIDHDVIVPADLWVKVRSYMIRNDIPIMNGLYYTKSAIPEPLIYRGLGEGPFYGWKPGDKVWASASGMGCTLIHTSVFKNMTPPYYVTPRVAENNVLMSGTEDFYFYGRVIEEGVLKKAGWKMPDPKHPILVDTDLFCQHIDLNSGKQYPKCVSPKHVIDHQAALKNGARRKSNLLAA